MRKLCTIFFILAFFCNGEVISQEPHPKYDFTKSDTATPSQNKSASLPQLAVKDEPPPSPPVFQTGVVSWYGGHHVGHKTANGERFDPNALTCAHRTLPMGTIVRVTDNKTGTSVVLRVNDRGPYVGHRILDITPKAASLLGISKDGLANVEIRVLSLGEVRMAMAVAD